MSTLMQSAEMNIEGERANDVWSIEEMSNICV